MTSLRECLAQVEPVKLLGMELLKQGSAQPQGSWFPTGIPRSQMVEAVTELVGYTRRCAYAAMQMSHLAAVPLTSVQLVEYGL
ncbi:hypothetical protein J4558_16130 [Leptolyngbya sp. 15MV]|nr:hypothetical protein J4558_16130 [Leptolyngbya sp. 15MV]